jgi:hypothetical protein
MIYFDSDMFMSTNTAVYFDWKTVIYIFVSGKCRTQFMLPMEKSVTFTGACADEIIPLINRLFVYKTKEGRHVRIAYNASFRNPREIDIRQSFLLKGKSSPQGTVTPHSK